MYHHTATSTAMVESRTQPVATERAVPTSTQTHLPLAIGKTNYHNTVTITEYVLLKLLTGADISVEKFVILA